LRPEATFVPGGGGGPRARFVYGTILGESAHLFIYLLSSAGGEKQGFTPFFRDSIRRLFSELNAGLMARVLVSIATIVKREYGN